MGIDAHALNLLVHAHRTHGPFGRVATLGRQEIHLGPRARHHWCTHDDVYGEELLRRRFGATSVDAIDNSSYEQASIIADMNGPLPDHLTGHFNTVVDLGCLEHIFDVAQSLRNVASLCAPGGRILHLLPANGFCGHGFYQFSPELFFSCYSEQNGYAGTELYFADLLDTRHWYRIAASSPGERINVRSNHEIYLVVLTRRVSESQVGAIQQSDYVHAWDNAAPVKPVRRPGPAAALRELALRHNVVARLVRALDERFTSRVPRTLRKHPLLTRVLIEQS